MKIKQLRQMATAELKQKLADSRRELLGLRIQRVNQQLKNPLKLRELRRQIARIMTLLKEKGDK